MVYWPYRNRCPKCGSTQVIRYSRAFLPTNRELLKRAGKTDEKSPERLQAIPNYFCKNCKAKFETPKDMLLHETKADVERPKKNTDKWDFIFQ